MSVKQTQSERCPSGLIILFLLVIGISSRCNAQYDYDYGLLEPAPGATAESLEPEEPEQPTFPEAIAGTDPEPETLPEIEAAPETDLPSLEEDKPEDNVEATPGGDPETDAPVEPEVAEIDATAQAEIISDAPSEVPAEPDATAAEPVELGPDPDASPPAKPKAKKSKKKSKKKKKKKKKKTPKKKPSQPTTQPELVDPPQPEEPQPVDPLPIDPQPVEPQPVEPQPVEPQPVESLPVEPQTPEPKPVEPEPIEPQPVEPEPEEPQPPEPEVVEPEPVYPQPEEPKPVEPQPPEPEPVEPEPEPEPVDPLPEEVKPVEPEPEVPKKPEEPVTQGPCIDIYTNAQKRQACPGGWKDRVRILNLQVDKLKKDNEKLWMQVTEIHGKIKYSRQVISESHLSTNTWKKRVAFPYAASDEEIQEDLKDCNDALGKGHQKPGVYLLNPSDSPYNVRALCVNGWTVVQRRFDGSEDFNREFDDYMAGFGNFSGEFFLGLENLHRMANNKGYTLRVDAKGSSGKWYYGVYEDFNLSDEKDDYRLSIGNMTAGNYFDGFENSRDQQFSTRERDNDQWRGGNCAGHFGGGWWSSTCATNLNQMWCRSGCLRWADKRVVSSIIRIKPSDAVVDEDLSENPNPGGLSLDETPA